MENKPKRVSGKKANWIVVATILVFAAVLMLASKLSPSRTGNVTPDDLIAHMLTSPPSAFPNETEGPSKVNPSDKQQASSPSAASSKGQYADAYLVIYLNNNVWGIEPLAEERDVTLDQGDGVVNVIHLLPDGFYMKSSTCDNQLCVSQGTVTVDNYQRRILGASVLCLPHGLDLELMVPGHTPDPGAPDI